MGFPSGGPRMSISLSLSLSPSLTPVHFKKCHSRTHFPSLVYRGGGNESFPHLLLPSLSSSSSAAARERRHFKKEAESQIGLRFSLFFRRRRDMILGFRLSSRLLLLHFPCGLF